MSNLLATLLLSLAAPIPGSPEAAPTVTAQTQPGAQLLETVKSFVKLVGGDEATKSLNDALKEKLGDKGFSGLDLMRPLGGYAHIRPKLEESWGVVVLPITEEKDFLDLLSRLGYKAEEKKDDRGHYEFTELGTPFTDAEAGLKVRMRFNDRCAYVAINAPADALAGKYLLPLGKLVEPADRAAIAVRMHLDRVDPALKKLALAKVDEWENEAGNAGPFPWAKAVLEPLMKVLKRNAVAVSTEGDVAALRVFVDATIGDAAYEFALTAKKDTLLAKAIADRKPTTSQFAGIIPASAVGGSVSQFPAFAPEIREAMAALIETAFTDGAKEVPEAYKPLVEELRKGAARTLKGEQIDVATALTGPAKAGHYTAVAALTFDDPSGVEKAIKDVVKTLPAPFKDTIKLDAAKAGGLSVHTAVVGSLLPPEAQKLFGEQATVYLAFAPKAVYVALGPDGLAELTRVAALKPGPARAFDTQINPKKIAALLKVAGVEGENPIVQVLGDSDKLISYQYGEVHGGESLRVRFGSTSFRMGLGAFWLGMR